MSTNSLRGLRGDFSAISKAVSLARRKAFSSVPFASNRSKGLLRVCRRLGLTLCGVALLCSIASIVSAQQISVMVRVQPDDPARVLIEGKCAPTSVWSFRDSYAGVLSLGTRVLGVQLFDAEGAEVQTRRIAPGQFEAAKPASRFRYEVNLNPPVRASDSAFVSWLNSDRGLLMLADLLPNTSAKSSQSAVTRDQGTR